MQRYRQPVNSLLSFPSLLTPFLLLLIITLTCQNTQRRVLPWCWCVVCLSHQTPCTQSLVCQARPPLVSISKYPLPNEQGLCKVLAIMRGRGQWRGQRLIGQGDCAAVTRALVTCFLSAATPPKAPAPCASRSAAHVANPPASSLGAYKQLSVGGPRKRLQQHTAARTTQQFFRRPPHRGASGSPPPVPVHQRSRPLLAITTAS